MPIKVPSEERLRVISRLTELAKDGDANCRWCGYQDLTVPEELMSVPRFYGSGGPPLSGGEALACAVAVCERCGYIHPFFGGTGLEIDLEKFDASLQSRRDSTHAD